MLFTPRSKRFISFQRLFLRGGIKTYWSEFAHQLDQETGLYNGTPIFEDYERYALWEKAMQNGFRRLKGRIAVDLETVINPYGATSMEEFFAVCTEVFFEKPKDFARVYPEVYRHFKAYYKLDPVNWR